MVQNQYYPNIIRNNNFFVAAVLWRDMRSTQKKTLILYSGAFIYIRKSTMLKLGSLYAGFIHVLRHMYRNRVDW